MRHGALQSPYTALSAVPSLPALHRLAIARAGLKIRLVAKLPRDTNNAQVHQWSFTRAAWQSSQDTAMPLQLQVAH